jgi:hypothetical protein
VLIVAITEDIPFHPAAKANVLRLACCWFADIVKENKLDLP